HGITRMMTKDLVDEVVIEAFVLYDKKYENQTYSPMQTSQLIGAIKWICVMFDVPIVEQGADKKKPTRAQLAARGIKQVGSGTHMRDAELHVYHRAIRAVEERDET